MGLILFLNDLSISAPDLVRYSDVIHEVTRVTKGYRFVLTFNLTADPQGARPSVEKRLDAHDVLRQLLKHWHSDISSGKVSSSDHVVHLLEHEYTEQGLKLNSLKGRDLHVVRALYEACSASDTLCFLAGCEKEVYGGCDEDYGYGSDGYHEIIDVCDTSLRLKRIVDMNGELVVENIDIDEEAILTEDPFEDKTPDEEDYSGYTGNEGVSATHWYRDTVGSTYYPMWTIANPPGHCVGTETCRCRISYDGIGLQEACFQLAVQQ